jgi:hypothetical protein
MFAPVRFSELAFLLLHANHWLMCSLRTGMFPPRSNSEDPPYYVYASSTVLAEFEKYFEGDFVPTVQVAWLCKDISSRVNISCINLRHACSDAHVPAKRSYVI